MGFSTTVTTNLPGLICLEITGRAAEQLFQHEAGGHRFQRVPPTEKRGRVQTSSVTVAVLSEAPSASFSIDDVEITTTKGSGPGGQRKNKRETCVVAHHRPTNIRVRVDLDTQKKSKDEALRLLKEKVLSQQVTAERGKSNKTRASQIGSGMRGDKRRTYREQDDQVVDHLTGQRWRFSDWMKGLWW